ncbi:tyrosine-type recombinase/integrase [Methylobacterium sp. NPDC080182]|uniref:tyrosine-type recombinase/integrase n=1 Tax=Methylobacterium sp. NPDC080182 TaxID=3390590 RepID=UPI003D0233FE
MSKIRLPYIDHFMDRHGTVRYYFRRGRGKRVPLPGSPGTRDFISAYEAARDAQPEAEPEKHRGEPGTMDRLVADYYESPEFKALKAPTKRAYRLAIDRLIRIEKIGHRKVRDMSRANVKLIMAKRADRPSAANDALKKLRILIRCAIDLGYRKDDPTLHIKKLQEGEHHTWSEEEIEAFEAHWPIGSQQRTAFALLIYTGQRVSDVARMSWADVSLDGHRIRVTQDKTGTKLDLRLHEDLLAILAAWPRGPASILYTAHGNAFSTKGLGNKMADAIGAAGLPDECVTHGLRKAAARRLAEALCTPHEIASITGHRSLAEVERYTRAASNRTLNDSANSKLSSRLRPTPPPDLGAEDE